MTLLKRLDPLLNYVGWSPENMLWKGDGVEYKGRIYEVKEKHWSKEGLEPDVATDLFEIAIFEDGVEHVEK